MQRSAQKGDVAADRLAAGKARDRLIYNGLEDRSSQVFLRRTFIDQGLDIGLGKTPQRAAMV